jgi:hypothetical protein
VPGWVLPEELMRAEMHSNINLIHLTNSKMALLSLSLFSLKVMLK